MKFEGQRHRTLACEHTPKSLCLHGYIYVQREPRSAPLPPSALLSALQCAAACCAMWIIARPHMRCCRRLERKPGVRSWISLPNRRLKSTCGAFRVRRHRSRCADARDAALDRQLCCARVAKPVRVRTARTSFAISGEAASLLSLTSRILDEIGFCGR